jgi:acetyl esterase/lipase
MRRKKIIQTLVCLILFFCCTRFISAQVARYKEFISSAVVKNLDIKYARAVNQSGDSIDLYMDVYQPADDIAAKRPLIIWIHGGGYLLNTRKSNEVVPLCEKFARLGYVTASIDYRMVPISLIGGGVPILNRAGLQAMQDARAAVRFFRKSFVEQANSFGIDTSRIFMGGSSAGGFTSLSVAYMNSETEALQAVSSEDWAAVGSSVEGTGGSEGYSSRIHGVINLCGGLGNVQWMNPGETSNIACLHGTLDSAAPHTRGEATSFARIPMVGSQVVDSMAQVLGFNHGIYLFKGAGHTPYVSSPTDPNAQIIEPYADTTFRFLRAELYYWLTGERIEGVPTTLQPTADKLADWLISWNGLAGTLSVERKAGTSGRMSTIQRLAISTLMGQEVFSTKCYEFPALLQLPDLVSGTYLVSLESSTGRQTAKYIFVK